MARKFTGSFTQQEGLSQEAIAAAVAVLQSGRLHRYNLAPGEAGEAAQLEAEYRDWQGSAYCLAVTSGGQALQIALRACGVEPGAKVLTNAYTLAPVPGAIRAVGAETVLVEIDEDLRLDLDDLDAKIASSGARVLLLSHMRGHLCDMDRLMAICNGAEVTVIEDCAHTMGAQWNGIRSGNFGKVACFSTQTYKHMNSGEGGFLTTDDAAIAARATILSGSYMLYERHGAGPDPEAFADARYDMPNCSARMDALRAAILRPQLADLDSNIARWNARYTQVEERLKAQDGVTTIKLPSAETHVGSSIQFRLPDFTAAQCRALLDAAATRGVELKWFGAKEPAGFTSAHPSWRYVPAQDMPKTDRIMATLFDMRLPLSFSQDDCALIAELICDAVNEVAS
ncbi:aminotransferase class I/II-fold pyridoxal phosphate-dependent enzyme [Sulfitobacter sp. OXR-159]|jgi:dTDP-4-amino-4,6-dideoxygalactose transaminase|uniref:DegT/DnrJ/EryC1/StrS family aminotransferase n=1 Tax=Sulfitobacter sp. OXR-159 TaxID=3100174 RepID=UPI002AC8B947|nr:aminotransferase class I/II-fold pyridoxal phosphate-dependent enzyme [Sulfitobacter sp. OXR-159]WPZ30913.1 aminotransferase class I/II-fold pyridoxal phosphate-dependent enzyme [Sulfitobacter sp. OXR-159]